MSGSSLGAEIDTPLESVFPEPVAQASRCSLCTVLKREQRLFLESWKNCHKNKVHLLKAPCAAQCAKVICIEFHFLE